MHASKVPHLLSKICILQSPSSHIFDKAGTKTSHAARMCTSEDVIEVKCRKVPAISIQGVHLHLLLHTLTRSIDY